MPVYKDIYYAESPGENPGVPPVVLIHGAGSNHLVWPAELRRLKGLRVLALDLPGHGRSLGTAFHTVQDISKAVVNFLSGLGIFNTFLVGHSLGGAVAQEIALNHPKRTAGLVLISSAASFVLPTEIMQELSNPGTHAIALNMLEKQLFGPDADEQMIEKTSAMLRKVRPGVLYGDWTACSRFERCADIHQIRVPTWIGVGSQDKITPVSSSRHLAQQIPGAELKIFRNAGHMLLLEQPQEIGKSAAEFLNRAAKYYSS